MDVDQNQKSSSSSEHFRVAGNRAFERGNFDLTLRYYNDCLCFAPPGSENIPLAYGNKAAVFCEMGKYALALENIALARKNRFPVGKMQQLNVCEKKCKRLMEEFGPDKNPVDRSFFKLSHPPNEKIPFIADCLELRQNEKYGRYIITNKDLKTGDIVAIEKPVIAWIEPEVACQSCFFCAKSDYVTLIPCSHCTSVMFCSEECQEKAALLHWINDIAPDSYGGIISKCLKMQLEAYRIAGGVDEALELLKDAGDKTIFDFDFSDPNDPDYEKKMLIALNGLYKITHKVKGLETKFLIDIPPINEKTRANDERELILKFIYNQFRICVSNMTLLKKNHFGISLFKNLINHSCVPNIQSGTIGGKWISYACRPIKTGEQLFVSYGIYAGKHSKEERQMSLWLSFKLNCDCEACVNDWPKRFPRKDRNFVEPEERNLDPAAAVQQFKGNCKYIDENAEEMPCYEVKKLIEVNHRLISNIAGYNIVFE